MKNIDIAAILAILSALAYMFGYVYLESYYSELGIDYRLINSPFETILTHGSFPFIGVTIFLSVFFTIIGLIPKKVKEKSLFGKALSFLKTRKTPHFLSIAAALAITSVSFHFFIEDNSALGKKNANQFLNGKCQLVSISLKTETKSLNGCLVPNGKIHFIGFYHYQRLKIKF